MAMTVINWLKRVRTASSKTLALGLTAMLLLVAAQAAEKTGSLALRADAPQQYTVKQGDTLWEIAGRFLEQPWMWPQVWQVNPQIKNPDRIYPGDVISLSYQDGKPVLTINRDQDLAPPADTSSSAGNTVANTQSPASSSTAIAADQTPEAPGIRTERRSPEVHRTPLLSPIPAIPLSKVFSFLSKTSVVDIKTFDAAPYLLGEEHTKTLFATGDNVYARGKWDDSIATYDIVREGRRFKDPDSGKLLGVESIMVGTATISSYNGDRALLKIDSMTRESRVGDRLIPRQKLTIDDSYLPQPPAKDVRGAIASFASGNELAGRYDTLVLNVGSAAGLQAGNILEIQKPAVVIKDEIGKPTLWQRIRRGAGMSAGSNVEYPGEKIGTVLIYRVFDQASLALVLNVNSEITLDYRVVTP
ncbi:MAG TPA: LysM peptidoglycan-binding domain-containing protein [Candidatus Acidoferrum sp.]|nr:LysM peptidoglycan-binding domain-containing protein [Candidatus Acidoferrum sp.]